MPPAIVWDCDGVLVDSERINNEVFAALVSKAGLPTTPAESVVRYMGRSTAECVADVEERLGRPIGFDLADEYHRSVRERHRTDLVAVPGARDLLDRLRERGTQVCVASSGTPAEIAHRLDLTGLARYFDDRVYSASMVARGKPAPDLFLYAAARLGVAPADCVLVEDSPYGVRGGRAAGMSVVGFAALVDPAVLRAAGADPIVTDLADPAAATALGL
jgi:HAD superfamily hydrolase (TIGR01509 family)